MDFGTDATPLEKPHGIPPPPEDEEIDNDHLFDSDGVRLSAASAAAGKGLPNYKQPKASSQDAVEAEINTPDSTGLSSGNPITQADNDVDLGLDDEDLGQTVPAVEIADSPKED